MKKLTDVAKWLENQINVSNTLGTDPDSVDFKSEEGITISTNDAIAILDLIEEKRIYNERKRLDRLIDIALPVVVSTGAGSAKIADYVVDIAKRIVKATKETEQ